ncbi:MAG TPA: recombinase family protein [Ruminococcus sp.]|nr:recombinase family protein [Ruminococcus sp.]
MPDKYLMYLRKSRSDGEHESVEEVLAKHYKILQDYARAHLGGAVPEDMIYREVVSGETIQDRPEVNKLLARIQSEELDGVIVVEPQRLSRGDLSDCGTIIRAFRYTSTPIVTPTKTYDLTDKFDRKFFEMELMRGNDYLEYIKEIMLRGRLASVNEGNFIGSVAPYGYDKVKDGKANTLVPNSEADTVRLIFELWTKEGLGTTTIANRLNALHIKPRKTELWSTASIRDMLKNPVYIGKIRWNWRKTVKKYEDGEIIASRPKSAPDQWLLVDGKHEPIISEEIFNASLDRFGKLPKVKAKSGLNNPFAGIMHCSCGRPMIYQPHKKCEDRLHCAYQMHCGNRSATYNEAEEEVIKALRKLAADMKKMLDNSSEKLPSAHEAVSKNLKKELNALETQQERLYEFLEQGIYSSDVFVKRNASLAKRRQELQEAIAEAQSQEISVTDYKQKYIALQEAIAVLEDKAASAEEKNRLLRLSIKDIVYHRETAVRDKWHPVPFSLEISLV